jgi:hypothetical protein
LPPPQDRRRIRAQHEHIKNLTTYPALTGEGGYRKGLAEPTTSLDGRYRKGLRIACLSNQALDHWDFPTSVIGKEETHRVFFEADWQEADALLCNPKLADDLLVALYQRSEPFAALPDDRWCDLITMSAKNPRLVTRNDTEDGPDFGHRSIQRAVFVLLRTAPTTPKGLHTLYWLLDSLDPQHVLLPESIDTELDRWSSVQTAGFRGQPREGHFTVLTIVDEFRCLLAALYGKSRRNDKYDILGKPNDADVAARCAYYGKADLDQKAMKKGYHKDSDVFTFAVLFNDHVLRSVHLRKLLEEEYLCGGLIPRYQKRCIQINKKWPNFNPEPLTEWLQKIDTGNNTRGSASPPTGSSEIHRKLTQLDEKLNKLNNFAIGIEVIVIWAVVFFVVLWLLDWFLGSVWRGVTIFIALIFSSLASGVSRRYAERQFLLK